MNLPKTRSEAKTVGAKYYFTGVPCKRGHVAKRKTKGCCVECMQEDWGTDNERRKSLPKSEAAKAAGRRYYKHNKEAAIQRANAQPIEKRKEYRKRWEENNKGYRNATTSARRRRYRQTYLNLSPQHKKDIRDMYRLAQKMTRITGIKYEVDHVIPINGLTFSGLHVPWNLQVIPKLDNVVKGNILPQPHLYRKL